ncbi:hypothetical protein V8E55_011857 [Tylopilus felleus]
MSDPVGNLRYCFTLIASWIADTPEESLLAATSLKVSSITMATSKNFGDARRHEPPSKLDFQFSLIQTPVGYWAFDEGISKLKQVTGCDQHAVQRYIIGTVAGNALQNFLIVVRALLDFRYLAQAPTFTTESLQRVTDALQEFHDHKEAIICHHAHDNWEIPKLELLQSVVLSICQSGALMQWSADITEHAHIEEIKVPAHAGNNQNYYMQITCHLDRLEKCFCFDLATHIEERIVADLGDDCDDNDDHEPDPEKRAITNYLSPICFTIDYFSISSALLCRSCPTAPKPFCTFMTDTTAFHLVAKPSLRLTLEEAAQKYGLLNRTSAIMTFLGHECSADLGFQVWQKNILDSTQTLCTISPTTMNPFGQYNSVIISSQYKSNWPKHGLENHSIAQIRIIFRLLSSDFAVTGMHLLKCTVRANGQCIGEVIPLTQVCSPAHLVPHFGHEAHSCLIKLSSYELSMEFWLNKYWTKEFYYMLSPPCI